MAVDHVSLEVARGTLKSIIGPNGAGKTTFFNLLSGQYRPSEGRIAFEGQDITTWTAAARTQLGIGRSFQLTNVFPTLSVLENVRLAVQARRGLGLVAWRDYRRFPELEDRAYAILEEVLLEAKWARTRGRARPRREAQARARASSSPSSPRSSSSTSRPPACRSRRSR